MLCGYAAGYFAPYLMGVEWLIDLPRILLKGLPAQGLAGPYFPYFFFYICCLKEDLS